MDQGQAPDAEGEPTGKRAAPRDSTFLQAGVRRGDEPAVLLRVRNLSRGGVMVEGEAGVNAGDPVVVELRNVGAIDARVAWVRPGHIGLTFATPIDPHAVRRAPTKSPGAAMTLMRPKPPTSRRPGLRIG